MCTVSLLIIEVVAAFVQRIYLRLAFIFVIRILCEAIWISCEQWATFPVAGR